ncbi:MAG: GNAT family N-acetyltransferase [Clostridia bacterium]|nr:GNAT family N-acetyltransferase [Clostridia bacterium]
MGHRIGERIMLREYRREDLEEMRKWVNDGSVTHYLSHVFLPAQTLPMTESFLERVLSGQNLDYNFVIADRQTGAYIGQVDLFGLNTIDRCAELGIVIGNPQWHGQGIGAEAITLMLDFAFRHANLQRIELWVDADNAAAIRCYEKAGFVHEGCRRKCHFAHGKYVDLNLMGALRDEWCAAHPAF